MNKLLDGLHIDSIQDRTSGGGAWVDGTIAGYRFVALVFAKHAANSNWELNDSCIPKLWLQRSSDRKVVANYDRGWDQRPTSSNAKSAVNVLTRELAILIYHNQ